MKKFLLGSLATVLLGGILFFGFTPTGKGIIVEWQNTIKKVDEKTYETRKKVEDQCRAMIASYNSDKHSYYQYRDSDSELERSWAQSYKQRANSTASTYNEYILKNSYVWEGNIPEDIKESLPYIED